MKKIFFFIMIILTLDTSTIYAARARIHILKQKITEHESRDAKKIKQKHRSYLRSPGVIGYIRHMPNRLTGHSGQAFLTNDLGQKIPVIISNKPPKDKSMPVKSKFYLGWFQDAESRTIKHAYLA